jgi:hypothetical protein
VITVLSESEPIARKQHNCSACEFILDCGVHGFGYTFAELRLIAKAKRNNYKIVKGQKYLKQNNVCDGEIYTFKAIPEMHELCLKYDHYGY